jgi:hypothetical protein
MSIISVLAQNTGGKQLNTTIASYYNFLNYDKYTLQIYPMNGR